MKKLIILFLGSAHLTQAAIVTLTAQSQGGTNGVAELVVGSYEVVELLSFVNTSSQLIIFKNGGTNFYGGDAVPSTPLLTIAGPATFRLVSTPSPNTTYTSFATFRITPEAYPPDRAILLPPGTNQSRIMMECSTNLVAWFPATNGVYGPLPEAKFFRIKLAPFP